MIRFICLAVVSLAILVATFDWRFPVFSNLFRVAREFLEDLNKQTKIATITSKLRDAVFNFVE